MAREIIDSLNRSLHIINNHLEMYTDMEKDQYFWYLQGMKHGICEAIATVQGQELRKLREAICEPF